MTAPTLFDTVAPTWPIHHPGSACCDPTQDLAGWIRRERARADRDGRWIRVLHQRGRRLRKEATRAWTVSDHQRGRDLDNASRNAHGLANAIAQRQLAAVGHLERVVDAHRERLTVEGVA